MGAPPPQLSPSLDEQLRRAHEALRSGDTATAWATLDGAIDDARRAGDITSELGARMARLLASPASADALDSLEQLAETAREHGLDELYAVAVLERAERLRELGRYGDAAFHAQTMAEWGERARWPALAGAAALSLGRTLRCLGRLADADGAFNGGLWAVGSSTAQPSAPVLYPSLPSVARTQLGLLVQHAQTSLELGHVARARESIDALAALRIAATDVGLRVALGCLRAELARAEHRAPDRDALRALASELRARPDAASWTAQLCRLALLDDPAHGLASVESIAASPDVSSRAELAITRAQLLLRAGRLDAATDALAAEASLGAREVDRLLLAATLAVARGTPQLAIEPALRAAAHAESCEDTSRAAAAWQLATSIYRRVGLVARARTAREHAATLYRRTGLRAPLAALEVERAWEALILGKDREAEAVIGELANVDALEIAAQVALVAAALAARRGSTAGWGARLVETHDRLVAAGDRMTAVTLARAAARLAPERLPASVTETLDWASEAQLADTDPLFIPPPAEPDGEGSWA